MPMVLSVTPVTQGVGGASIFRITGGPPGGTIAWSSTKNGVPTGEDHAQYPGQQLDAEGNWQASGGNWPASMVGEWTKTAYVYPPDGSNPWVAEASFRIVASQAGAGGAGGAGSAGGGLLDGSFNVGGIQIPKALALIGGVAALFLLMPSSGGGRR